MAQEAVSGSATERSLLDLNAAPWVSMAEMFERRGGRGSFEMKSVTAPDGRRVGLVHIDGTAAPHFHTKASSFFVLKGRMELRDRFADSGTWAIEPYGAIHPRTQFHDVTYGLGMAEGDFGTGNVILEDTDNLPGWLPEGARLDDYTTMVDSNAVPWVPFGDGISIKVLYVFDGRPAFAALGKAEAGSELPRRRYLGPADMYILSGRAEFGNAVATPGIVVHEPAGAEEGKVRFPVETEFLANTYGTVLEFGEDRALTRIIDGFSLRPFAHVRTDGPAQVPMAGTPAYSEALMRMRAAGVPRAAI